MRSVKQRVHPITESRGRIVDIAIVCTLHVPCCVEGEDIGERNGQKNRLI